MSDTKSAVLTTYPSAIIDISTRPHDTDDCQQSRKHISLVYLIHVIVRQIMAYIAFDRHIHQRNSNITSFPGFHCACNMASVGLRKLPFRPEG